MKVNIEKIRKEKPMMDLLNFSLINLDKPTGPTSFQISQFVKDSLGLKKTSHMGTLDPQVSGVLPITLGRACRLSEYFMHRNKTYVGIMRLHEEISIAELKKKMKKFVGKITQMPPVKSRVKRTFREREVESFEILEKDGKDVLFETEVEAGTYIRKLIHDLGESIGGAHMLELRRTKAGFFSEEDEEFVNLYEFEKAVKSELLLRKILIPAEVLALYLPVVQVKEDSVKQLLTGKPLHKADLVEEEKFAGGEKILVFCGERFLQAGQVVNEGDIVAKADFVLN